MKNVIIERNIQIAQTDMKINSFQDSTVLVELILFSPKASLDGSARAVFFRDFAQQQATKISHRVSVPPSLTSPFRVFNISTKPLALLLSYFWRKYLTCEYRKYVFKLMLNPCCLKTFGIRSTIFPQFAPFLFPEQFMRNVFEGLPDYFFVSIRRSGERCVGNKFCDIGANQHAFFY